MSKGTGGYFTGKEFWGESEDPNRVRRAYAIAWGKVVKQPSEKDMGSGMQRVCIRYRAKRYIMLDAWGDGPAAKVMRNLTDGDYVFCVGQFVRQLSNTKHGEKWTFSIHADIIFTAEMMGFLYRLLDSRILGELLAPEDAPDEFECIGDEE